MLIEGLIVVPIKINKQLCDGCGDTKEPACMRICPGDLIYKAGQAVLRNKKECSDCSACVKVCPQNAIELYYPVELGGRGSYLTAQYEADQIIWQTNKFDGSKNEIAIKVEEKSNSFDK